MTPSTRAKLSEEKNPSHRKTSLALWSGKKQHGPDDKIGHDAGGNEGSKGQNVDARRSAGTGKQPSDIGDERGRSRTKQ